MIARSSQSRCERVIRAKQSQRSGLIDEIASVASGSFATTATMALASLLLFGCHRNLPVQVAPLDPIVATSNVDRATLLAGEKVTFSLTVEHDSQLTVTVPEVGKDIAGMRVVDFGTDAKDEGRNRKSVRRWYQLEADLSGSYVLPAIEIPYRDRDGTSKTVKTGEVFVEVQAEKTAAGEDKDIRDIKEIELSHWPWRKIAWGALALALLGSVSFAIWRARNRKKTLPSLIDPPHVVALRTLQQLRYELPENPVALRAFHFRFSETIRTYLEAMFAFAATDMTLEEIRRVLPSCSALDDNDKRILIEALRKSDEVKFAETWLEPKENSRLIEEMIQFVGRKSPQEQGDSDLSGSQSGSKRIIAEESVV